MIEEHNRNDLGLESFLDNEDYWTESFVRPLIQWDPDVIITAK